MRSFTFSSNFPRSVTWWCNKLFLCWLLRAPFVPSQQHFPEWSSGSFVWLKRPHAALLIYDKQEVSFISAYPASKSRLKPSRYKIHYRKGKKATSVLAITNSRDWKVAKASKWTMALLRNIISIINKSRQGNRFL